MGGNPRSRRGAEEAVTAAASRSNFAYISYRRAKPRERSACPDLLRTEAILVMPTIWRLGVYIPWSDADLMTRKLR